VKIRIHLQRRSKEKRAKDEREKTNEDYETGQCVLSLLKGGSMKRRTGKWFVLVFLAAVMLSLSSCGGGGGEDTTPGTIELNNNSIVTIDGFYLAPVDQASWGPNILGGPLFPGQQTFIVDIFPGFYDAKVRGAGVYSDYFGYLYDIPIGAGDYLPLNVYNSSFTGSLEIRNTTVGASIIGVYVVRADAPTWGANQASSVIRPSGVLHLTDLAPGFYDVLVVWNVGPDSIDFDVRIDSLTLTTLNVD
jgi:hypothetical protein